MFEMVTSVPSAFLTRFKSRARIEAEGLALRHQVNVLKRTAPKRVRFTGFGRLVFVWLYRLWPELPVKRQGEIRAFGHLGGLHHSFVRL